MLVGMIPHYTQPTEANRESLNTSPKSPASTNTERINCFDPQLFHQDSLESSNSNISDDLTPQTTVNQTSSEDSMKPLSNDANFWGFDNTVIKNATISNTQRAPQAIRNRNLDSYIDIVNTTSKTKGIDPTPANTLKTEKSDISIKPTKSMSTNKTLNSLWGLKTSEATGELQEGPEKISTNLGISSENNVFSGDGMDSLLDSKVTTNISNTSLPPSVDSVMFQRAFSPKMKSTITKSTENSLSSLRRLPESLNEKPLCSVQKITVKTLGIKQSKKQLLVTMCLDKEKLRVASRPYLVKLKVKIPKEGTKKEYSKLVKLDINRMKRNDVLTIPIAQSSISRSLQLTQRLLSLHSPSPPPMLNVPFEPNSIEFKSLDALRVPVLDSAQIIQPAATQMIKRIEPVRSIDSVQSVQLVQSVQSVQSAQSAQTAEPTKPKAVHPFFMKKYTKKQSTIALPDEVKPCKNDNNPTVSDGKQPAISIMTKLVTPLSSRKTSLAKPVKCAYPLLPNPRHIRDPLDRYSVPVFDTLNKPESKMKSKVLEIFDHENIVRLNTKSSIVALYNNDLRISGTPQRKLPIRKLWNEAKLKRIALENIPEADKSPIYSFLFDQLGTLSAFDNASREEQQWSDKYSPKFTDSIAVDNSRAREVLGWVTKRLSYLKNLKSGEPAATKKRKRQKVVIDGSAELVDFVIDDKIEDDGEETDSDESLGSSVLILSGLPGVGKTTSVYACGAELGAYIFEINSSQKRSAKDLMTLFEGMSRSHLVHKNTSSINGEFYKSDGSPAMDGSEESLSTKIDYRQMGILLLEDVDVLFQDDKTFWTGVEKFIEASRRPIIMTCSDVSAIPLSIQEDYNHTNIQLSRCDSTVLKNILWLIALNEGHLLELEVLEKLVFQNNFDLKSAINSLQFWCQMGLGDEYGGLNWVVPYRKRVNDINMKDVRVISLHTISLSDLEANSIKNTFEKDVGNINYYDGSKMEDYITDDSLVAFTQLCDDASFSDLLKAQNHTCFEQDTFELMTETAIPSAGAPSLPGNNTSSIFSSSNSTPRPRQTAENRRDSLLGLERINNHVKKFIEPLIFEDAHIAEEVMFRSQKLISERFNCKYFTSKYMPMPFKLQSSWNSKLRQPFVDFTYRSPNHSWYNSIDTLAKWKLTTDITPYIRQIAFHELVKLAIFEERKKDMEDTRRRSTRSARALGFDSLPRPYLEMDSLELNLLYNTGGQLNQMVKR